MNVENFMDSLQIMGMGMLSIFIVTLVIISAIALLNKLTGKKK